MARKILIADDDPEMRNVIRISLKGDGYEIHEAKDGYEALDMASALRPDLIVLDVMMPGMVGYRVCQELKKEPETEHILILILTARDTGMTGDAALDAGADDLMSKPFLPKQLRDKVRLMLEE